MNNVMPDWGQNDLVVSDKKEVVTKNTEQIFPITFSDTTSFMDFKQNMENLISFFIQAIKTYYTYSYKAQTIDDYKIIITNPACVGVTCTTISNYITQYGSLVNSSNKNSFSMFGVILLYVCVYVKRLFY